MVHPYLREPEFISQLKDGTVKQLNPFSGTEVWTVAGRGNRPLGVVLPDPVPLDPAQHGRHCALREREMSFAFSSTLRCFETAGRLMANGSANSLTVASPRESRASIARRVGSARANRASDSGSRGID